ncbi:Dual specificity protein kinase pom1 [Ophiocordyceps camponoti-floridani]|uniref:Dual specificity protein kinase pom1 n=1 Tax=Ophiocordyceps camponoti-floridani TaxID=2030778 RepID=A0A8H4Q9Z7_9HYPO|nr:Dual specificity protein kinase pom1 [Ophiocordyceps camponoti-floridani]
MTLKHRAPPAGPRPANSSSPARPQRTFLSSSKSSDDVNTPMLASNNHHHPSLPSVPRNGQMAQVATPYDFLPSVSFDDLHASIETASTDLKRSNPPPKSTDVPARDPVGMIDRNPPQRQTVAHGPAQPRSSNPPLATRTGRSGSILRGSNAAGATTTATTTTMTTIATRQSSNSSVVSSSSGPVDSSSGPATGLRSRRQSHYPPISNVSAAPKPPRKSVGPGMVGAAATNVEVRTSRGRRPSLLADRASVDANRRSAETTRRSVDSFSEGARNATNSRAIKAKSALPPARTAEHNVSAVSGLAGDDDRLSTLAARSPRVSARGSIQPAATKRASMMPGAHPLTHATGLGARTVSPTDTRRMKRLSTMPQSQSLNAFFKAPPPPPPLTIDHRAQSRSPSMIPRRTTATPSSARTTPDVGNRKSYSSVGSVTSLNNSNNMRASSGSLQPRISLQSMSRLPAPKHSASHSSLVTDGEEDVPPVPAIPKAYESPKDSSAEVCFSDRRKTSLGAPDSLGGGYTGTAVPFSVHPEPTKAAPSRNGPIRVPPVPATSADEGVGNGLQTKKHLQPLRLPPLNLGPLKLPPRTRITDTSEAPDVRCDMSPPPSRQLPKTPSSPMTASKTSFFSKKYDEPIQLPNLRSTSTIHHTYRVTPTPPDASSSSSSFTASETNHKPSLSPFLSTSLPKGGFEPALLKRSKTGADSRAVPVSEFDDAPRRKPVATREPVPDKTTIPKSPPPPSDSTADEPPTPSSINSLRRKLSLSWMRSGSKGNNVTNNDAAEKPATRQYFSKQEAMPPPRIPTSVTTSNLSISKRLDQSPAVSTNGSFLELRRRKDSTSSLTAQLAHDRVRSDNWGNKKERSALLASQPSHGPVAASKVLRTRAPNAGYSAVELDKDDLAAEEEMRKMGSRRKETEVAAKCLDTLKKRATSKERVGPQEAIRIAMLNIYERGEVADFEDVYFCGTQNANKVVGDVQSNVPNFGYDDERGDYTIVPGDHLAYRYEIIDVLGKGSFGQVVRCIDHKHGALVAVKIIRNKKRFHQQALVEVNILQKLREWDPNNRHSMVSFTQHFYFRGHLCISTELLDMNLYEFIKAHAFCGFSLRIIRRFTKQILSSLILLKQRKVIHCDLKPENILLRHPLQSEIKVIDFGSSCFETEKVYTYIQSRFYRSPEVILGMTYGMPIDMWSVGCILAELYTGVPIFPGENEQEQLACIMEVFGPPEKHLIEKSTRRKLFFDSVGKPRLTVSSKGRRRRPSSKTLQQVLKCDDDVFVDFLSRCLRWDPERRLKPEDAIRHEFISGQKAAAPATRLPARDTSPVRRSNTVSSTPRPLPDPPGVSSRGINGGRTASSPQKIVPITSRRISGATGATAASNNRRTSAGSGSISSGVSGLPRAAGRTTGGRADLAAAGAAAAMTRRA